MKKNQFLRVQNSDDTIEYWEGETRIAFINEHGTLQATRGNADHKEVLSEWIASSYPNDLPAPNVDPTGEASTSVDEVPSEHNKEVAENVASEEELENIRLDQDVLDKLESQAVKTEFKETDLIVGTKGSTISLPIICPIVGSNQLGDKDPAVVNWWRQNHPEEFKRRYSGRRIQTDSGIIV